MSIGLILVLLIGVVILVLLIMWLVSKSKGKITISLDKYEYRAGETINGTITLSLKKPVNAKGLFVGLEGISSQTRYVGKRSSTQYSKVFEFKKPIDGEKLYPTGERSYPFQIIIPANLQANLSIDNPMLGTVIKAAQILSGSVSRIRWYVTANLDMPGFDISKRVQINIV